MSSSASAAFDYIRCRICRLPKDSTDELRRHLIDSHREELTAEELQSIIV
jgi:hypothetical protein